jgi:adenylylsulfate kinase
MKGCVVWLTGLPASGKTTLSHLLQARFGRAGVAACVLDGDVMRAILTPELGYSDDARREFYATLARLAAELAGQGLVVLVPATAHRRDYRKHARELAPRFIEVWVSTSLEECRRRDPKGLYASAEKVPGHLPGIDLAYEEPASAEVLASGGGDALAVERIVELVMG